MNALNLGSSIKNMLWVFFFHIFLKRFQKTPNFLFDVESKQNQFKNNPKIVINQIDLA
jgi:hypothetical protein